MYTRPPVTRVVNDDIKLARPPQIVVPTDHSKGNKATTYKPVLVTKKSTAPPPTTFHPITKIAQFINRRTETSTSTTSTTSTTTTTPKPSTSIYTAERPAEPIRRPPIRPNIKDLLATIGLTAEVIPTSSPQPPPPELTPEMRDLLNSFGLLTNEAPPKTFPYIPELNSAAQEEFVPIPSYNYKLDDSFHVDEAAPIQTDSEDITTQHYKMNTDPDLSPRDFYAFKPLPLPEEETYTSDMESFFKSVGLLDGNNRNKKSMYDVSTSTYSPSSYATMDEIPEVRVDFLSPDMLSVLGNLGISNGHDYRRSDYSAQRRSDDVALPTVGTTSNSKVVSEKLPIVETVPSVSSDKLPTTEASKVSVGSTTATKIVKNSSIEVTKKSKESKESSSKEVPIEMPIFKPVLTDEKIFVVGSTMPTKKIEERVSIILPTQISHMMDEAVNVKATTPSVVGKVTTPIDETAEDFAKLQHLLETIRQLEKMNRTLTNEDLDLIDLRHYNLSKTLLDQHGPDPVDAKNAVSIIKNEVKRQSTEDASETPFRFTLDLAATTEEGFLDKDISDIKTTAADSEASRIESIFTTPSIDTDSTSTTFSASSSTSSTTSSTTTTSPKPELLTNEERKNGLEDSFGGNDSGLDPVPDEKLPPPRRNGFYFFSDWNSFLEVGEDPDKVVVRFDPKLGDSSRFIPVEIPSKSFR